MNELDLILQKLETFRKLEKNWDSYRADPPNEISISNTKVFLDLCNNMNFLPKLITPTCVGGVFMLWQKDNKKVMIEFYNSGKSSYLTDSGKKEYESKMNENNEETINNMKKFLL